MKTFVSIFAITYFVTAWPEISFAMDGIADFDFVQFQELAESATRTDTGVLIESDPKYRIGEQFCTPWVHADEKVAGAYIETIFDIEWNGRLTGSEKSHTLFQIQVELKNEKTGDWDLKKYFFRTDQMNEIQAYAYFPKENAGYYGVEEHNKMWVTEPFELAVDQSVQICILDVRPQTELLFKRIKLVTHVDEKHKGRVCQTIRDALTHRDDFDGLTPLRLNFSCQQDHFSDTELTFGVSLVKKFYESGTDKEIDLSERGQVLCLFDSNYKWRCFYELQNAVTGSISHFNVKEQLISVAAVLNEIY